MKTIAITTLTAGLIIAPLAQAATSPDNMKQILNSGTEYGVTHFVEIEHDNDDRSEIEGWVNEEWLVEVNMNADGSVTKEERRKRIDGPWGLTADEVRLYIDAAASEGMEQIDEIKLDTSGYVEVEGYGAAGRDIEVDFRIGSAQPVSVERDN